MDKTKNGRLIDDKTGNELKIGDEVTDFRGTKFILKGWTAPRHSGSTGRVHIAKLNPNGTVAYQQEFFPGVINAHIVDYISTD